MKVIEYENLHGGRHTDYAPESYMDYFAERGCADANNEWEAMKRLAVAKARREGLIKPHYEYPSYEAYCDAHGYSY